MSNIKRNIQVKDETDMVDDEPVFEFIDNPVPAGERLLLEMELEKAQREYELSKYSTAELKDELLKRGNA